MPLTTRLLTAGIAGVLLAASATVPASGAPSETAGAPPTTDRTSTAEATRVDRVKTPQLRWATCHDIAECATVKLPLDYDDPNGATTSVAVLRVKATDQRAKIGSLFVNPGGPGASATQLALSAPAWLSDSVLARFDIVGVDPRGIAGSQNVKCFRSAAEQQRAHAGLTATFPWGKSEEAAFVTSAKAIGAACSTTGKKLAGAMSTAEVARDMDVLRRAVGDQKLSYLGFSYGTALGQYYANMFPDRVRAVVVDGVVNPVSWAGTAQTANTIQDDRLRSADGAYQALQEMLRRCDKAGPKYCAFSAGDPVKNFDFIARKLREKPVEIVAGYTVTYADFISTALNGLYAANGNNWTTAHAADLYAVLTGSGAAATARTALIRRIDEARRRNAAEPDESTYNHATDAYNAVMCTDGQHPADASAWPAMTAQADKRAPYFGRAWGWASVACARNTWTVRDEDAYQGPFTRRTAAPVLVVGSRWDPATNYLEAVSSAGLLPGSRLLSSENWGHTAYGSSACVTGAIDGYLLRGALPAKGTTCVGDVQPFTRPIDEENPTPLAARVDALPAADTSKQLPPIAVRVPVSMLDGTR